MANTLKLYTNRTFILALLAMASLGNAKAQDQATLVRQTVDKLFDGMRSGDSAMVRSVFLGESLMTSVSKNAKDSVILHKGSVNAFVKAFGTPHPEKWDERIYDVKISVDGPMAIVWAPYKFYLGEKFSHCGVNVFTIILTKAGWKINEITDTRRKEGCP